MPLIPPYDNSAQTIKFSIGGLEDPLYTDLSTMKCVGRIQARESLNGFYTAVASSAFVVHIYTAVACSITQQWLHLLLMLIFIQQWLVVLYSSGLTTSIRPYYISNLFHWYKYLYSRGFD